MIDSIWMKIDIRQTPDDKTLCMPGWMTTAGTPALDDEGFFEMSCSCYLTPDQLQRIFNILIETGEITCAHPILRKKPECMTMCHSEMTLHNREEIEKLVEAKMVNQVMHMVLLYHLQCKDCTITSDGFPAFCKNARALVNKHTTACPHINPIQEVIDRIESDGGIKVDMDGNVIDDPELYPSLRCER